MTASEYLERLEPEKIQQILHSIVSRMIRRKTFDDARYHKKWLIIVDATQTYSGTRKINDNCLETHHNKGTDFAIEDHMTGGDFFDRKTQIQS